MLADNYSWGVTKMLVRAKTTIRGSVRYLLMNTFMDGGCGHFLNFVPILIEL